MSLPAQEAFSKQREWHSAVSSLVGTSSKPYPVVAMPTFCRTSSTIGMMNVLLPFSSVADVRLQPLESCCCARWSSHLTIGPTSGQSLTCRCRYCGEAGGSVLRPNSAHSSKQQASNSHKLS